MTIILRKTQLNNVVFTLNESVTLDSPSFILEIESKVDYSNKLMWLNNDVSLNVERYNEYIIEMVDKIDEDLENMKVYLNEGEYNFYVWETESINLSKEDAFSIIESGRIKIK